MPAVDSDPLKYCINLVRTRDYDNFMAALLLPNAIRAQVFSILAFNVELAMVRNQIQRNSGTAGIYRLQFWKDAIDTVFGHKVGPLPRQPAIILLCRFANVINSTHLYSLITARQQTLGDRPFANISTLEDYGIRTHGAILNLLIDAVSRVRPVDEEHDRRECDSVVQKVGAAMGIATHLRSMAPLCARGIVILPADLLTRYALTQETIYNRQRSDALRDLARDMANNCRERLTQSRSLIDTIPKSVRIALLSTASVDIFLSRLDKCHYDLFDARLQRRHASIGWRMIWQKMMNRY